MAKNWIEQINDQTAAVERSERTERRAALAETEAAAREFSSFGQDLEIDAIYHSNTGVGDLSRKLAAHQAKRARGDDMRDGDEIPIVGE